MRRLATQQRGGAVKSNRDYQQIIELGDPISFDPRRTNHPTTISLRYADKAGKGNAAAFGGYFAADSDFPIRIALTDDTGNTCFGETIRLEGQRHWTRVGHTWIQPVRTKGWTLTLEWNGEASIAVWGLQASVLTLPDHVSEFIQNSTEGLAFLNKRHLAPESFYLPHETALGSGKVVKRSNLTRSTSNMDNPGKKCSQCQRHMPVDPRLQRHRSQSKVARRSPPSMVLAFHGHKSKKTGYQNECRACKKFEINDYFNIRRTPDQFHESSVLTRERKLLLRENEAIREFKQRVSKKGLRHYIWTLFDKRCFKCGETVKLNTYQLDHTRPLAYLWPLDRYGTCLCAVCNNNKKDSFPVEFYNDDELRQLSEVVDLPLKDLRKRSVNQAELRRIRSDIVTFAKSWSPRLFDSVATRVRDVQPKIDLFAELRSASQELHDNIVATLRLRPAPVLGEDELEDLEFSEE